MGLGISPADTAPPGEPTHHRCVAVLRDGAWRVTLISRARSWQRNAGFEVGEKVRQTIDELGGTMPEALPMLEKGIQQIGSAKKMPEGKPRGKKE